MGPAIWISTVSARVISGVFNYFVNKNLVFEDKREGSHIFLKYFGLWLIQLVLSAFFVALLDKRLGLNTALIKVFVDGIIFIMSFKIQDKFIFS